MPVSWTPAMDQKLLLAVLSVVKLDTSAVARKWAEIYGDSGKDNPTTRAITEHILKLKKDIGIAGSSPSKPSAPKPRASPVKKSRSPASSDGLAERGSPAKRRRNSLSDDEDSDSETYATSMKDATSIKAEDEFSGPVCCQIAGDPVPTRQLYARTAKMNRKPLVIDETTDESELEDQDTGTEDNEPRTPESSAPELDAKLVEEQLDHEMAAPGLVDDEAPGDVFDEIAVGKTAEVMG